MESAAAQPLEERPGNNNWALEGQKADKRKGNKNRTSSKYCGNKSFETKLVRAGFPMGKGEHNTRNQGGTGRECSRSKMGIGNRRVTSQGLFKGIAEEDFSGGQEIGEGKGGSNPRKNRRVDGWGGVEEGGLNMTRYLSLEDFGTKQLKEKGKFN